VEPRKPSRQPYGEGNMNNRKLNETIGLFRRGNSGGMWARTLRLTGEAFLVPHRNARSKSSHITGSTGKLVEDEKVGMGKLFSDRTRQSLLLLCQRLG
jgi:hypothetical protein